MREAEAELELAKLARSGIVNDRHAIVQPKWRASGDGQNDAHAEAHVVVEELAPGAGIQTEGIWIDVADIVKESITEHGNNGNAVLRRGEPIRIAAQCLTQAIQRADRLVFVAAQGI